jgi:hypothetical protein
MPLDRSFRQRIAKLERNTPPEDDRIPSWIIIDARINRDTDIEAEISRNKSGWLSHLTRKQIGEFLLGKRIETVDPDTGRPLLIILANPQSCNGNDHISNSSKTPGEEIP